MLCDQMIKQKEVIQRYQELMFDYLKSNREKQIEALYAIEMYAHMNALPQFLLNNLFNIMYDLKLIDQETFHYKLSQVIKP